MIVAVISWVWTITAGAACFTSVWAICHDRPLDRGRHVSVPMRRRIGRRVGFLRTILFLNAVASSFAGHSTAAGIIFTIWNLWLVDDALFPEDDDDRKRKYEWAKVRLRMPKPVKLRPIQKWAGAPA